MNILKRLYLANKMIGGLGGHAMESLAAQQHARIKATVLPLSLHLREETFSLHRQVEQTLGLPDSIRNLMDYQMCLTKFYRLYKPIEASLGRFGEWSTIGVVLSEHAQSGKLAQDLGKLSISLRDLTDAPPECVPEMLSFPNALGILYVLVGSTLGSQFILPQIAKTLGAAIKGADTFFRGHGVETKARWTEFQASLNLYGEMHPDNIREAIDGASAAFSSIGDWMQS